MIDPERSDVETALQDFDLSHITFLNASARLLREGLSPDTIRFGRWTSLHTIAFGRAAEAILVDSEITDGKRATLLERIYVGSEHERVKYFNTLAPEVQFHAATPTNGYAANKMEVDLIRGVDREEMYQELIDGFGRLLGADVKLLMTVAGLRTTGPIDHLEGEI